MIRPPLQNPLQSQKISTHCLIPALLDHRQLRPRLIDLIIRLKEQRSYFFPTQQRVGINVQIVPQSRFIFQRHREDSHHHVHCWATEICAAKFGESG
ncbi:hypothetical protein PRUPE_3G120100 [Prunus persica]|uniref:Uncharacterized protein n=1 Tax=Prunus persica TaxID=3760 RepID=A0A251PYW1_PRUPE|nr:hypothetical protein PRUPE_3G120100 [Prunus persica]